ncbi:hypothetical protein H0H81_011689 [Sphagnurus paluster]|uniref:Uncharacterized protein n=1 Tax=Sphagnurus paluster TaxID=117069 RepID=A0A9P7FU23_9AGAR|nr:hypothetical protein H0H81_011689 [Sphagnurus paluster]
MASIPRRPEPKIPALGPGQTVLLGGAIVIASLGGFYLNLRRIQNKRTEQGAIPHYEYLMAHVASRSNENTFPGAAQLPISRYEHRATPLPSTLREHHSAHSTIPNFKMSPAYAEGRARYEQPTPQRPREPGSSVAYTKSPDYVKSYEKLVSVRPKVTVTKTEKASVPASAPVSVTMNATMEDAMEEVVGTV